MTSARYLAFDILRQVSTGEHTLDYWLERRQNTIDRMNRADRALLHALVYGVLRWQGRMDWIVDQLAAKPGKKIDQRIRIILRLGLFQLLHLDRIPPSAAVNTSVELTKGCGCSWARGFVNSILRSASAKTMGFPLPRIEDDPVHAFGVRHSFPAWLIERWLERYGIEQTGALCKSINTIPPLTLRVNTLKADRETVIRQIRPLAREVTATRYSADGILLRSPDSPMNQWSAYKTGCFQVQSEGSQLVACMLDAKPGHSVWDACAGLGTKTAQIAQHLKNRGNIVATDLSQSKLNRLDAEMQRLGARIVTAKVLDASRVCATMEPDRFDRILLDAPCSGLGVLQKNPDGKWHLQPEDINRCARIQTAILDNAAACLKPCGILVYAVCSTEPEETTDIVRAFLQKHREFAIYRSETAPWADADTLRTPEGFLATQPHHHNLEGFFAAALIKQG